MYTNHELLDKSFRFFGRCGTFYDVSRPTLSCIIITLNEEKYLPRLLESLKSQTVDSFEVIVADYHSTDDTRRIARDYGCVIINGGDFSAGRNRGASKAKGDYLLFLDADCILPSDFIEVNLDRFKLSRKGAATTNVTPLSSRAVDWAIYGFYNLWSRIMARISPHGCGASIFATRQTYEQIGGFDERVVFAENHDFVRRAKPFGFMILPQAISTSVRRLKHEGRIRSIAKSLYSGLYRLLIKELDKELFKYDNHR